MKIVDAATFLDMPPGTVFAFGPAFSFSGLLVKEDSIRDEKYWGFWACDPCWIASDDNVEMDSRLYAMKENGASFPMNDSATKYMNYGDDEFECFLVFEFADLVKLLLGSGT